MFYLFFVFVFSQKVGLDPDNMRVLSAAEIIRVRN